MAILTNETIIEAAARAAHEANRAYCLALGDQSQPSWEDAPEWQRTSAINGVRGVLLDGNSPKQSHESWLREKHATGWRYGPVKDPEKKEHPCCVPYEELPPEQKVKDDVFVNVVKNVAIALGWDAAAFIAMGLSEDDVKALYEYGAKLQEVPAMRAMNEIDDRFKEAIMRVYNAPTNEPSMFGRPRNELSWREFNEALEVFIAAAHKRHLAKHKAMIAVMNTSAPLTFIKGE